jgi:hypothetical protein
VRAGLWALGLFGFLVGLRPLRENDLFWHLTLGREVLRQGARSFPEPVGGGEATLAYAPEWLFDVLAFGAWRLAGDPGLSLLVATASAAAAVAVGWMLWRLGDELVDARRAAWWGSACLAVVVASVRFKPRPETLGVVCLALLMVLAVEAGRRPTTGRLAAVALLVFTWAQVHGLFVLALPVVAAGLLDSGLSHARRKLLLLAVVGALLLSGAHGAGVFAFVSEHLHNDALEHIVDMQRPAWALFEPGAMLFGPLALVELALAGLALAFGRLRGSHASWAALGVLLLLSSARGLGPFAVLCAPAALAGAALIVGTVTRARAAVALGLLLLGLGARRHDALGGPLGQAGFAEGAVPGAVLSVLRQAPPGTVAVTSYGAGAVVGFFLGERVRVTLDSRTPLQFTALDYALARDAFQAPEAMRAWASARGATAAVVERGRPECDTLTRTPGFVAVAVDSRYAAFAAPALGLAPLETLEVCRPGLVSPRSCAPAFEADLERLREASPEFLDFLRAARALGCERAAPALPLLEAWRSGAVLRSMRPETTLVAIDGYAQHGDYEAASALAVPLASGGHAFATQRLLKVARPLPAERRRAHLGRVCEARGDACPFEVRAALLEACEASGDAACVAFHGPRVRLRRAAEPRTPE